MLRTKSHHFVAARIRRTRTAVLFASVTSAALLAYGCLPEQQKDSVDARRPAVPEETSAWSEEQPAPDEPSEPAGSPIPADGSGEFATARDSLASVGKGTPRRYRVQVEDSLDLSLSAAAREVNAILGDPRGWTASGEAFQLVASKPADFTVKIATPATVDAICGAAGLDTQGQVNCTVGSTVVVNLRRWQLGSPQFDGPIEEYRALIINHEVGHRLGHGHEGCPGPGKPAPAMMQQIKGLDGCEANAWPYDREGRYIEGPSVD
ncbi:DUF3152 domain-containing protein [Streptomyces sp. HC44]|uniref:DUF3152 domain-containing protein n=1 Tax=Streptomyces scabichelini TaxID=2711217 RepID=A0A6G4VB04_9ACTN|nr:DUF3152 domain-containing protein [Streptomyces scabichelini]NGO10997.1 DUF3152 domain-containing protein [Streptomyces scabichelini]